MNKSADQYSVIGYTSKVHPCREPGHIATIAALYGVEGPDPRQAAVFEIGCGRGHALIALALMYPQAQFYGIDASATQIEAGTALVKQLKIENLHLETSSISQALNESKRFDYVICHGVFSWIPAQMQEDLLKLIEHSLSANGLAYLSYNTWPGWNFRRILRDLLAWQLPAGLSPEAQITESRRLLKLFEDTVGYEFERPYSLMMNAELKRIREEPDSYLFHELLESENNPLFFWEMQEKLEKSGLFHIADARLSRNAAHRLLKDSALAAVVDELRKYMPNQSQQAQFLDFAFHTPFRESLICKKGRVAEIHLQRELVERGYFAASFEPLEGQVDLRSEVEEEFIDLTSRRIFVSRVPLKAALIALRAAWPKSLSFEELWSGVKERIADQPGFALCTKDRFAELLLEMLQKDGIDLSLYPSRPGVVVSERPKVSAFARQQACYGRIISNLRYESVELGDFERDLMQYLDGTHDREMLLEALLTALAEEGAELKEEGQTVLDPEHRRGVLIELLDQGLDILKKAALLLEEV